VEARHRVLMVVGSIRATGGMEVQLATLAEGLTRAGHTVTLVSLISARGDEGGPSLDDAVGVIDFGAASRRARLAAVVRLAGLARSHDVVHCTGWDASLWGRLAAILARRPVIVAEHAGDRSFQRSHQGKGRAAWIAAHNRLLDPLTHATVVCATVQRPMLQAEGVAPRKIVTIPNGVPVADMRRRAVTGITRGDLGIPPDAKVLVHVATFRAMKRQALTLQTTRRLREVAGDVRVVFAGDGPELAAVQALADGAPWALFLGRQDNVAAVLALGDLAVLPSSAEAMPMVVIEAIAMGLPVVASAVGEVPRVLDETGAGVVFQPSDPDEFYLECLRVLADPEHRRKLVDGANTSVPDVDASTMVHRYEGLLDSAVAGGVPAAGALAAAARP
jgi:glycosyltransferase involved in cell wall biosynthesis